MPKPMRAGKEAGQGPSWVLFAVGLLWKVGGMVASIARTGGDLAEPLGEEPYNPSFVLWE